MAVVCDPAPVAGVAILGAAELSVFVQVEGPGGVVDVVVEIGLAGEPALLGTGFCWDISVVLATGCDIISGNVLGFSV